MNYGRSDIRIMVDTNILVSAILFPSSKLSTLLWDIMLKHKLVICSYTIDELHEVFERKFSDKVTFLEQFLSELTFELIYTPRVIDTGKYPDIRDPKDLPILVSTIFSNVEMFITGDKDFHAGDIDYPRIITPQDYMSEYMI